MCQNVYSIYNFIKNYKFCIFIIIKYRRRYIIINKKKITQGYQNK